MSDHLLTETVQAGKNIIREGDPGDKFYLIRQGEVRVRRGPEQKELAILREGDFFGEMALFRDKPRSATARVTNDARLAVIDSKPQLEKFLSDNPLFASKMVNIMATRLAQTNDLLFQKISELSAKKMEYK